MPEFPPDRIEDALKFCCCSPYQNRQICIYAGGGSSTQHDMYWAYAIYDDAGDRIAYENLQNCLDVDDGLRFCEALIDQWDAPLSYEDMKLWRDICEYLNQRKAPTDSRYIKLRIPGCGHLVGYDRTHRQKLWDKFKIRANPMFLERLAFDLGDRIKRIITPDDSQNWIIARWRGEHFTKIHQAGKRSINLILYEVTQEGDLTTNHTTVTIRARIPSDAIRRHDGVEIGGILLQGELLGWVEDGQQGWFLFSPNTQQVNTPNSSSDKTRITFTTHPKVTRPSSMRLAAAQTLGISMEELGQMIEQGQIELPRSGYFDRWLESPPYLNRPIQLPRLRRDEEVITPSTEIISGRWHRYDDIHADSEYEGLGIRTCKYNAKSRMVRCAVNPCGPCEGCKDYEKI